MYRALLVRNIVGGTPMVVARRLNLLAHGGFDESLAALEDYELWLRLARHGARFRLLRQALTRCHTTTAKASVTKSAAAGLETFARIEGKLPGRPGRAAAGGAGARTRNGYTRRCCCAPS
jgi:GT2 family glycosyltransferase